MRINTPLFAGQIIVRTASDTASQQVRLHDAIKSTDTKRADGTQPVLHSNAILQVLRHIPITELQALCTSLFKEQPGQPTVIVAKNQQTATIDYGNNETARRSLQKAIIEHGVDVLDTEGDIYTQAEQAAMKAQYIEQQTLPLEKEVGEILKAHNLTVATAESCTGGLASSRLTDVSGSSDYILFNAVTYCNDAKSRIIHVDPAFLAQNGPYNAETARQMAEGVRKTANTTVGLSFTGLSGSSGADGEPAGSVYIGLAGLTAKPVVKHVLIDPNLPRILKKQVFAEYGLYYLREYLKENCKPVVSTP